MATLPHVNQGKIPEPLQRGSEKLLRAWKTRILTDESVREIANALEKSPAKLESCEIIGGEHPTGLRISLRYDGEDGPWCGNDIQFWLLWLLKHGGHGPVIVPPKIIINGIPWPEFVRMELNFGRVETNITAPATAGIVGVSEVRG